MKLARSNRAAQRKRDESAFEEVVAMIEESRRKSYQVLNAGLIDLYWQVGQLISRKIAAAGWGKNTLSKLAAFVRRRQPNLKGFSASNLWRMRQFYDTYAKETKLAPLVRELNWTQNLLILARAKRA